MNPENLPIPLSPEANQLVIKDSVDSFLAKWGKWNQLADVLLKSGFLPKTISTREQVVSILLLSYELKIPAMTGLFRINVIDRRPTLPVELMVAIVRRTGELESFSLNRVLDEKDPHVECAVKRKGFEPITTRFGKKEAVDAQLYNKDNYQKRPWVMYEWRSISANFRLTFPDALNGVVYTPEEMGAEVVFNEEGTEYEISQPKPDYNSLAESLQKAIKEKTAEALSNWLDLWKSDIEQLPENHKATLKRMYMSAVKELSSSERSKLNANSSKESGGVAENQQGKDSPTQSAGAVSSGNGGQAGNSSDEVKTDIHKTEE